MIAKKELNLWNVIPIATVIADTMNHQNACAGSPASLAEVSNNSLNGRLLRKELSSVPVRLLPPLDIS